MLSLFGFSNITYKLLVIRFVIKLYARNSIFKYIKRRHGQDIITLVRSYESLKTKYTKVQSDIKFIKSCKKENLIHTFAKVNPSIKNGNRKLKIHIARIVMESEMENKHHKKKKFKKDIVLISNQLKIGLGVLLYNVLLHQVNIAIRSRYKLISIRHQKKIIKFTKNQKKNYENNKSPLMKHMVHNFSSYALTEDEMIALAYGLDHHIPTNFNINAIFTKFEQFFQNLLRDISHIPEKELSRIKTKLRNTCEKYCNVKVSYKYRDIVSKLSKREDIVILKQDKGRRVVLMDRHK